MKKLICFLAAMLLLCGCSMGRNYPENFEPEYPTIAATEPASDEEILAYRRDVVEQAMREQSAILWKLDETVSYSRRSNSQGVEADKVDDPDSVYTLHKDRVYQGMPYTHGSGSYYSFLSFAVDRDENGVYILSGITDQHLNGIHGNREHSHARISNDCADQVFWAWARISSSIRFEGTVGMTSFYGCLPVGDYENNITKFTAENNSRVVTEANGEQRMYASYACLQKGDAMVHVNAYAEGHAVMVVASDPVYLEDGTIDGEKSTVTILEQTSGCEKKQESYYNEEIGEDVYPLEIMDKEWTYETIFGKGYLPVTCKELVDPSPRPEPQITDYTDAPTYDNMFGGVIKSNYRISSVTATITRDGEVIQEATAFGHQYEMYDFNLFRFLDKTEQMVIRGGIDKDALEPGSYHCTFTARISTGDELEFRSFDFTK